MYVVLQKWDAIELFCNVVAKYENRKIKEFWNNIEMDKAIKKYKHEVNYSPITEELYGGQNNIAPKAFYNFQHQINTSLPVIIPSEFFTTMCSYIGEPNFAKTRVRYSGDLTFSDKQLNLYNSNWWIYFYDEHSSIINNEIILQKGISKGLLKLLPFGKAELIRDKYEERGQRIYTGIYSTFREDNYLSFKMRLMPNGERDLRMTFFLGSDHPIEFAIGQSSNVSSKDHSRIVVIERTASKNGLTKSLGFYSKDKINNEVDVPDYIQDFFEKGDTKMIVVPDGITSSKKLRIFTNDQ